MQPEITAFLVTRLLRIRHVCRNVCVCVSLTVSVVCGRLSPYVCMCVYREHNNEVSLLRLKQERERDRERKRERVGIHFVARQGGAA